MSMLITLFLVLINIFNIVTTNSPNVEGMTAIGAWMLVCIFFVFGALGESREKVGGVVHCCRCTGEEVFLILVLLSWLKMKKKNT